MKVAIIGTGYVGLPTGIGLAELGNTVVCVDKIAEKWKLCRPEKPRFMKTEWRSCFRSI